MNNTASLLVVGTAFVVGILGVVAWIGFHVLKRLSRRLAYLEEGIAREGQNTFQQLEALQALYVELRLQAGLPATRGWAGSPDFLLELATYIRRAKPKIVVECSSGVSTIVIARCLQLIGTGHVFSLEHDPQFAERTRHNLQRHNLIAWATVLDSPLVVHRISDSTWPWYALNGIPEGPIDLLVIDGPPFSVGPLARYPAGPLLFGRLAEPAAVFLDDAGREDEQRAMKRWSREFPRLEWSRVRAEKGLAIGHLGVSERSLSGHC